MGGVTPQKRMQSVCWEYGAPNKVIEWKVTKKTLQLLTEVTNT